jgi:hypothetical protein
LSQQDKRIANLKVQYFGKAFGKYDIFIGFGEKITGYKIVAQVIEFEFVSGEMPVTRRRG